MTEWAQNAWDDGKYFVYVRIPKSLSPFERSDKYEDPLIDGLARQNLGEVVGGGSRLGEGKSIAYCGIDVLLNERSKGFEMLTAELRRLGAPSGTVIEEFVPTFTEHAIYTEPT